MHCGRHATPASDDGQLHEQCLTAPSAPAVPSPLPPPTGPVGAGTTHRPIVNMPAMPVPAQNDLCIVAIDTNNRHFNVLRLSLGPTAPSTPFDIILPSAAAFFNGADKSHVQYPPFIPATCGWHSIFERVAQPTLLWDCWGPGSLGEYPDVLSLWKSWDEGARIAGVGQRPPLRLVDAQWGCRRDVRSKKGHLRCGNPGTTRTYVHKWSQYQFFTRRIKESVANGRTAPQAIHELEGLCSPRTVPQLHCELQPKGQKQKQSPPTKTNSTAAAGGTDDD
ncbi:hypothetical protein EDB85DRAFT_1869114 [Lactarius pseudohatsudake]|nr:hypothetical protein EDB85DRAFT_1869114 [Lactarius pseudohatsudake]